MKVVSLSLNDVPVGELRHDGQRLEFVYAPSWIHRPEAFPLGSGMPLLEGPISNETSGQSLEHYLDAHLPMASNRRSRLAAGAGVGEGDRLGLLAHYGREGMGAATWADPNRPAAVPVMRPLTAGDVGALLEDGAPEQGGLLPGRVPKMAVVKEEGADIYTERGAMTPTTHVVKAAGKDAPALRRALVGEWLAQRLARRAGLPVVEPVLTYWGGGEGVLLEIPRFDRHRPPFRSTARLCMALGGQLINAAGDAPLSPSTLSAVESAVVLQAAARRDLYRWAIFNILVGNTYVHLNKLAAVRWTNGWMLAPFFGMRSTVGNKAFREGREIAWEESQVSFVHESPIAYSELTREWLVEFGLGMGMTEKVCEGYLDDVVEALLHASTADDSALYELASPDQAYARWVLARVLPWTCARAE